MKGRTEMKVTVEGNLFIESDAYNFILKEQTVKKDGSGEGKTIVHGYFSNIEQAMKRVLKMKIKQSTATTLQELVRDIRRIEEYFHSQLDI
jgi:hypothetical protein